MVDALARASGVMLVLGAFDVALQVNVAADLALTGVNITTGAMFSIPAGMPIRVVGDVAACVGSRSVSSTWQGLAQCVLSVPHSIFNSWCLRHFNVLGGAQLELDSLALLGGNSSKCDTGFPFGGAVFVDASSSLVATNCAFVNNSAAIAGGAVASLNPNAGAVRFSGCNFTGNAQLLVAEGVFTAMGGGAVLSNGDVMLDGCVLRSNSAAGSSGGGGALLVRGGVTATDCTFANNTAATGGAVSAFVEPYIAYIQNSNIVVQQDLSASVIPLAVSLNNNMLYGNVATGAGGAVSLLSGAAAAAATAQLNVLQSSFVDNSAGASGGSIFSSGGGTVYVVQSLFSNNSAGASGGALNILAGILSLSDVAFTGNAAAESGGGLFSDGSAVELYRLACSDNYAVQLGGCISVLDSSSFVLGDTSTLAGNVAARGGALALTCSAPLCAVTHVVADAQIENNSASGQGGALYVQNAALSLANSGLSSNVAAGPSAQGGALFAGGALGAVMLTGVTLTSNAVRLLPVAASLGAPYETVAGAGVGGAILLAAATSEPATLMALIECELVGNGAASGAGRYVGGNASVTLSGTRFLQNSASNAGGAVALLSGTTLSSSDCDFTLNTATNGGAFYMAVASSDANLPPPVVALTGGTASGNVAAVSGGLFYTDAAAPIPAPSCVGACTGNTALNGADKIAGVPLTFNCTVSALSVKPGALLPPVAVTLFDSQGALVMAAPGLTATVAANVSGLSGVTLAAHGGGSVLFAALRIAAAPGTAVRLTYTLHAPSMVLLDGRSGGVDVSLAACDANEVYDWDPVAQRGTMACLCRRGAFLSGGACESCPAGTFSAGLGLTSCALCPPGSYANADGAGCTACQAGTFLNASSQLCQPCSPGSYSPAAGAVACTVNPAGFASATQTTFSSNVTLGGVSSATFGDAQNATLTASIAATLNVSAAAVTVTSVTDVPAAGRRRALQSGAAAVAFAVRTTTQAASLRSSLGATSAFAGALSTALRASADPVLSAVTGVAAAAPTEAALVLAAEPCPRGTYLDGLSQQCEACLPGLVALSTGATACEPCQPNFAWASASQCVACPLNSLTSPSNAAVCACRAGYYDRLRGANATAPLCAPCPPGGVCTTGFVAAAEGWWREDTRSDLFFQCRVGNCLEENVTGPLSPLQLPPPPPGRPSDNCAPGNTGPLCAVCLPGYALQSGECAPCKPENAWRNWSSSARGGLVAGCVIFALIFLALVFLQPVFPELERVADAATARFLRAVDQSTEVATNCFHRCCCCFAPTPTKEARKSAAKSRKTSTTDDAMPESDLLSADANGLSVLKTVAPVANGNGASHSHADTAGEHAVSATTTKSSVPAQASGSIVFVNGASEAENVANPLGQVSGKFHHRSKRFDVGAVERSLASNAVFAVGNVAALVTQVDGGIEEEDTTGAQTSGIERQTDTMDRIDEFIIQLKGYTKILVKCARLGCMPLLRLEGLTHLVVAASSKSSPLFCAPLTSRGLV